MTNQDVDAIMVACDTWAQTHHRTRLTIQEASAIRVKLKARLHSKLQPKPDQLELVTLAHRLACSAVANRRDRAQRIEHQRIAPA